MKAKHENHHRRLHYVWSWAVGGEGKGEKMLGNLKTPISINRRRRLSSPHCFTILSFVCKKRTECILNEFRVWALFGDEFELQIMMIFFCSFILGGGANPAHCSGARGWLTMLKTLNQWTFSKTGEFQFFIASVAISKVENSWYRRFNLWRSRSNNIYSIVFLGLVLERWITNQNLNFTLFPPLSTHPHSMYENSNEKC